VGGKSDAGVLPWPWPMGASPHQIVGRRCNLVRQVPTGPNRPQPCPTQAPSRSQAGTKLSAPAQPSPPHPSALCPRHPPLHSAHGTPTRALALAPSPGLSWPGTLACGGGGATSTVIVMARKTGAYDAPANSWLRSAEARDCDAAAAVGVPCYADERGGWADGRMADGGWQMDRGVAQNGEDGMGARISLVSRQPQQRLRGQGWWRQ
jgi:hypothetical protein